jgi:hypothetical protein
LRFSEIQHSWNAVADSPNCSSRDEFTGFCLTGAVELTDGRNGLTDRKTIGNEIAGSGVFNPAGVSNQFQSAAIPVMPLMFVSSATTAYFDGAARNKFAG